MADIGGPVEAIRRAADEILNVYSKAFGELGKSIAGVVSAFRDLPTSARDLGRYALDAGRAVTALGKSVVGVGAASVEAANKVVALGRTLASVVELANPVVASQFAYTVRDLMAVLGQALVPVLKLVTELVRAAGDTLVTFASDVGSSLGGVLRPLVEVLKVAFDVAGRVGQQIAKVFEAFAPALEAVGAVVLQVVQALAPLVNLLVELLGGALGAAMKVLAAAVEAVAPVLIALAKVVGQVVKWIVDGIRELLSWLGVDLPDTPGTKAGASVGAATRQASTTDVESVIRRARENAFTLGTASADPAKKTAGHLESLDKKADRIIEVIKDLPERIARIAFGDGVVDAVEGAVDAVVEAKDAVLDAGRSALTFVGLRKEDKPGGAFDDIVKRADEFRRRVALEGGGGVVGPE